MRMDVERHTVSVDGEHGGAAAEGVRPARAAAAQRRPGAHPRPADRPGLGRDYVGDTKTLDVHVKRLRAKIEPDPANPKHLVTVRGLGYKFEPELKSGALVPPVGLSSSGSELRRRPSRGAPRPGRARAGAAHSRASSS